MALEAFATISGVTQGDITGDAVGTYGGVDVENMNRITSLRGGLSLGGDAASGRPTGRRQHQPLAVSMPVQASMPQIHQACATNESLEVEIKLFQPNAESGMTEHFSTIGLNGARVSRVALELPDTMDTEDSTRPPMLHVEFTFSHIRWVHETASREAEDDWAAGDPQ